VIPDVSETRETALGQWITERKNTQLVRVTLNLPVIKNVFVFIVASAYYKAISNVESIIYDDNENEKSFPHYHVSPQQHDSRQF
jgi:hypothetical protein